MPKKLEKAVQRLGTRIYQQELWLGKNLHTCFIYTALLYFRKFDSIHKVECGRLTNWEDVFLTRPASEHLKMSFFFGTSHTYMHICNLHLISRYIHTILSIYVWEAALEKTWVTILVGEVILVAFRNLPDNISASKCGDSTGFLYHVGLEVNFVQRHGLHNFRCLGFGQVSIVAVWAVFVLYYQDRHGPTQSDAQSSHASCPFGVSAISFLC